jgi:hypothetical protein
MMALLEETVISASITSSSPEKNLQFWSRSQYHGIYLVSITDAFHQITPTATSTNDTTTNEGFVV